MNSTFNEELQWVTSSAQGHGANVKGDPRALWVGVQTSADTVDSSVEGPPETNNGSALRPCDLSSGHIFEETQNINLKEYMHPYVHCSIIYNRQDPEATQLSITKYGDICIVIHIVICIVISIYLYIYISIYLSICICI